MAKNLTITPAQAAFENHFKAMVPLILSEWPQLIEENLVATEGDLDLAVAYISDETDQTQTLTRRHLDELATLIEADRAEEASPEISPEAPPEVSPQPDGGGGIVDALLEDGVPSTVSTFLEETIPSAVSNI
ncbi:MAG: hypothetical protein WBG38_04610, partial [Nodosilinea sp.]